MRRLSRFSVRELLLSTLVIALGIALILSRIELGKARVWQGRTYALQAVLEFEGFEISWHPESEQMEYRREGGPFGGQPTNLEYYASQNDRCDARHTGVDPVPELLPNTIDGQESPSYRCTNLPQMP